MTSKRKIKTDNSLAVLKRPPAPRLYPGATLAKMATNNATIPPAQAPFLPATPVAQHNAVSPPSKRDLTSWWKNFKKNAKREEEKGE